jgi:hypothetical protein
MLRVSMAGEETREAKYLYCIIKCSQEGNFNGVPAVGGHDSQIHTVVFKDLACVVSGSLDTEYDSTRVNMMAHETVIERVMREFTVLPIRFGTVTTKGSGSPVEDIRHKLLERHYDEFLSLHEDMSGRVELGLKVLWRDEKAIYQEVVAENRELRRLRDSIQGRSAEATHFDRVRLGEMVKKALDQKRDREARMLLTRFHPIADRIRENRIIIDRMVLNAALLVNKDRERECDEMVERLDEELGERMVFKYTGPNPPFNFCQITVKWEKE